MELLWGIKNLRRHPVRTVLSLAGIAVASAMLLDMVMLSGGLDRSFEQLLLRRGYQIRVTPKGTLPFDTDATIPSISSTLATIRAEPGVEAAAPVLGASLYGRRARGDSLVTLVGYGIDPAAQALYEVESGSDLEPGDTLGVLLSVPAAAALGANVGDSVVLAGRLDPGLATAPLERRLVARGMVRWLYDYRGQRSVGTTLPVMQRLAGPAARDRVSLVMVRAESDALAASVAENIRERLPAVQVNSTAQMLAAFRERMVYFRQLSYVLATMSLIVAVLLVGTLLTITVNERLGEIATLRAIGLGRGRIVAQVVAEGTALTVAGAGLGIVLGLVTARYLDAILTTFPGLPAAFSFFVRRADSLALAAAVLVVTGSLAGLYPAWLAARAPIAATLRAEAT